MLQKSHFFYTKGKSYYPEITIFHFKKIEKVRFKSNTLTSQISQMDLEKKNSKIKIKNGFQLTDTSVAFLLESLLDVHVHFCPWAEPICKKGCIEFTIYQLEIDEPFAFMKWSFLILQKIIDN